MAYNTARTLWPVFILRGCIRSMPKNLGQNLRSYDHDVTSDIWVSHVHDRIEVRAHANLSLNEMCQSIDGVGKLRLSVLLRETAEPRYLTRRQLIS